MYLCYFTLRWMLPIKLLLHKWWFPVVKLQEVLSYYTAWICCNDWRICWQTYVCLGISVRITFCHFFFLHSLQMSKTLQHHLIHIFWNSVSAPHLKPVTVVTIICFIHFLLIPVKIPYTWKYVVSLQCLESTFLLLTFIFTATFFNLQLAMKMSHAFFDEWA